jgi:hypothetical protein
MSVFAAFAVVGFAAAYIGPTGAALTQARASEVPPISLYSSALGDVQTVRISAAAEREFEEGLDRDSYSADPYAAGCVGSREHVVVAATVREP